MEFCVILGGYDKGFYGNFIDQLKPSQKSDILINLLKNRYLDFYNFFNCDEVGFKSHNMFVKEFLTSLSWQTFLPNSPIISRGENLENLYLIESGKVIVLWFIIILI